MGMQIYRIIPVPIKIKAIFFKKTYSTPQMYSCEISVHKLSVLKCHKTNSRGTTNNYNNSLAKEDRNGIVLPGADNCLLAPGPEVE